MISTLVLAHLGGPVLAPLQLGPATLSGCAYAVRAYRLSTTSRAIPRWRQVCFYTGLALIVFTLTSPLGHVADELFVAHMAEHLLLGDVAALLLVLGLTGPLLAPLLRYKPIDRLRALTHPAVALPLWTVSLYAWHLPALHEAAVRHAGVHALQHLCFIAIGANMWMAVFGPFPRPAWFSPGWQCGYILAVRLIGAVLGNVLVFGGHAFYGVYASGENYWNITPDADQTAAGAVMMIWESILTMCLFAWIFMRSGRETLERQELIELAEARGVALTPERAERAVAAGRGGDLRRRIEEGTTVGGPSEQQH